jgi:GNAT superfamily N-acetyltransferase
MADLDLSKAEAVRLSEENSNLVKDFDCGDDELNEFLGENAIEHAKSKIAVTYLFLHEGEMLGFFSVSMSAIKPHDDILRIFRERGKEYTQFPSVLIGRLGVNKRIHGQHVGTELIKVALGLASRISDMIACRFIVVDSYHQKVGFYEKNGFRMISKSEKTSKLYLDLLREF